MLFKCINYTASDYLKGNSAIKLILWAQNKRNCQKETVHPKSHEKKNNLQTFSACSFIECSLPPDVQSASTTGTDKIIQWQNWWGECSLRTFWTAGGSNISHLTPNSKYLYMGILKRDSSGKKIVIQHKTKQGSLIAGCLVLAELLLKAFQLPWCMWGVSSLHVQMGHWCACIISFLRLEKREERSLGWVTAAGKLQWHRDCRSHQCQ